MTNQKITISTTVNAPVERVWQAYTSPVDIMQWNFASDDWCCPRAQTDLRVGGTHKARMEARDGSMGFDFVATYEEMKPKKALTLAMIDGRKARTTFEAVRGGTKVTTTFDAETENAIDMQRDGWQAILDNFKAHTENQNTKG
ncbi:SRPBCC family protein [Roseovarius arcticus]|uniref:SRPBCC family protein n=1 Tax=Roseovarius arcticus TaxID=2547404 RepID=UPI0011108348|nr:SRPBCC family protein [Roseovarius arcticus]